MGGVGQWSIGSAASVGLAVLGAAREMSTHVIRVLPGGHRGAVGGELHISAMVSAVGLAGSGASTRT